MTAPEPTVVQAAAPAPVDLVELGVVRGAYGLQGWCHVQPHSADAAVLRAVRLWWLQLPPSGTRLAGPQRRPLEVTGVRAHGAGLVAKWSGCDDPETAQGFKACTIAVARASFPRLAAGQFYWVDLIGARVLNRAGQDLGAVLEVSSNGAHEILAVAAPGSGGTATRLIPMVPAYIDDIDLAARCIRVDWQADW